MKNKTKKYLFFDANMYRSFFSDSEVFSEEFLNFVKKLVTVADVTLLIPQQVKEEVERNYTREWFLENQNSLKNKQTKLDTLVTKLDLEYEKYSKEARTKIKKEILREKKWVSKKIEESKKQYLSPKSKSRVKLSKLFKFAEIVDESEKIRDAAFYRKEKGNPPNDGTKLGDKIIWETILFYFREKEKGCPTLIFLSRDDGAWKSKITESLEFDPWLQREFKQTCGGKVVLIQSLSDIPGLTKEEQQKIKEEEEEEHKRNIVLALKTRIPERLKSVGTFAEANKIMRAIESRIDLVDLEIVELLLKASLENENNTIGPYNQVVDASRAPSFFSALLQKSINDNDNLKIWKDFYLSLSKDNQERFYDLRKSLQDKGVEFDYSEIKYIHVDDIPF